jgi:hypothetical protein
MGNIYKCIRSTGNSDLFFKGLDIDFKEVDQMDYLDNNQTKKG